MTRVPAIFDNLLALPMPAVIVVLLAYWGLLAVLVHRVLVPWIAGRNGHKLGRLEAEVPAQIGLAFGLLISFIAIPVWDQHSRAEEAARTEAAMYREMWQEAEDCDASGRAAVTTALRAAIDFLAREEWPLMGRLESPRVSAPPLRDLRNAVHALPDGGVRTELRDLLRQATEARETRLRIAATRPPPTRWTIVGVLGMLTLLGVGLIHADSYRARRVALSMVAVGISCCFVILLAYTRPYLGQLAVKPVDLVVLCDDMATEATAVARGGDTATRAR
jgi:hypothetical protein